MNVICCMCILCKASFFKKKFVKMEDKFTLESSDYVMLSGGDNENSQKNQ